MWGLYQHNNSLMDLLIFGLALEYAIFLICVLVIHLLLAQHWYSQDQVLLLSKRDHYMNPSSVCSFYYTLIVIAVVAAPAFVYGCNLYYQYHNENMKRNLCISIRSRTLDKRVLIMEVETQKAVKTLHILSRLF